MGICCVVVDDDGRAHTLTRSIVANLFETKCVCVSIKSAPKTIFAINVHNIPLFKSCSVPCWVLQFDYIWASQGSLITFEVPLDGLVPRSVTN